ncbi:DUF72 domain-containing protein [Glaciecola siphonariae]|uniref:DUF72 domain-containing protein n=1 Tax=Glaciecola siphonariae TaxID=521012 RepID=A0ABV9LXT4_9ALTE
MDKVINKKAQNKPLGYRLGLPAWAFSGWKNKYFTDSPSALASYASVFNMVEGNTTFYQTPSPDKVQYWKDQLEGKDFQICFKLPQSVTHNALPNFAELSEFIRRISPLQSHLGPLLLVFPASVGPKNIDFIERILQKLPADFKSVIEVRHQAFFDETGLNALNPILNQYGAHRVVLDSRPLYRGDQQHPDVVQAKHEKPKVPVLPKVYNGLAFVRLVMHPHSDDNGLFIRQWAKMLSEYFAHDIKVYFSLHCPNNLYCPSFAKQFHQALLESCAQTNQNKAGVLPEFPVPQQSTLL